GQHYPGWHNPVLALVYFTRAAQIDAALWEFGFGLMAAAVYGVWLTWRRRLQVEVRSRAEGLGWLLWLPLPFYIYSIAYGAVPIFLPQLAPHAFYNARYGMELLPALSVYPALSGEAFELWLRRRSEATAADLRERGSWTVLAARFWQPVMMVSCVLNSLLMMAGFGSAGFLRGEAAHQRQLREALAGGYLPAARRWAYPLVLQEGLVNAQTRVPFEHSVAQVLETIPQDEPVLMSVTAHVGAVQDAGRTLKSMVSEGDEKAWQAALAEPAQHAAYVIAMEGDPVAKAVAEHPEGLAETEVVRSSGQPVTRIYQSTLWKPQTTR
ncbi:MAG TPA: hypothetical protein VKV02_11430, partial [Acidobacteriaceae bacterium]|nr:hypothetical protein [Acidobacteriaceae bacterium]